MNGLEDVSESDFTRLVSLAGFENAGELLMKNNSIAFRFMKGYWSSGATNMHFYENSSNWWASWEITGIQSGTWRFEGGGFYITDGNGNETKAAQFTVVSAYQVTMYVVSTGKTFNMARQ